MNKNKTKKIGGDTTDIIEPGVTIKRETLSGNINNGNIKDVIFIDVLFKDINIDNIDFKNNTFQSVIFRKNKMTSVRFINCLHTPSFFNNSQLENVSFINNNINELEFNNCDLHYCNFTQDKMENVTFIDCDLTDSDFKNTNLNNSTFINCNFTGVSFNENFDISLTRILKPRKLSDSRLPEELQEIIIRLNNVLYPNSPYNSSVVTDSSSYKSSSETLINNNNDNNNDDDDYEIDPAFFAYEQPPPYNPDYLRKLLQRSHIIIKPYKKSKNNLFEKNPSIYDVITMEDTKLCEYINDPNNLIFIYNKDTYLLNKQNLRDPITTNSLDFNKIIYQCKKIDEAATPRESNLKGEPQLSMDLFGIHGVMIPLSHVDSIINNDHQIYIIDKCNSNTPVPIASLKTILSGSIISANHCQALVPIKSCSVSYVDKKWLTKKCLTRCPKGTRRNKKTGDCDKKETTKETTKKTRCPNGTRRNKKTGECEEKNKTNFFSL